MKRILLLTLCIITSWTAEAQINASDTVVFDLLRATCTSTHFVVPVSFKSDDMIYAIDFSMKYNQTKITYNSIINYYPATVSSAANYTAADSTLRFTSFCMSSMPHDTAIVSVRFNLISGPVTVSDFNTVYTYLNGDICSYKIIPPVAATIAASGPTVIVSGDTLTLTGTPANGLSYLWSTGSSSSSITITTPGTYAVTVTTPGGCSSSTSINIIPGSPLPVELVNFTATEVNDAILLAWSTASEINNDYFMVERSADGNSWNDLEKISGSVNSSTVENYNITDTQPYTGLNYYRLKQTDFDGSFSYSQIISLNFKAQPNRLSINLFPNPAAEILNITATETATLQLFDANGQMLMLMPNVPAGSKQQINTHGLSAGIYILKTFNESSSVIKKVVIRN